MTHKLSMYRKKAYSRLPSTILRLILSLSTSWCSANIEPGSITEHSEGMSVNDWGVFVNQASHWSVLGITCPPPGSVTSGHAIHVLAQCRATADLSVTSSLEAVSRWKPSVYFVLTSPLLTIPLRLVSSEEVKKTTSGTHYSYFYLKIGELCSTTSSFLFLRWKVWTTHFR